MNKRDKYDFLSSTQDIAALVIVKGKRIYTPLNLCRNFNWPGFYSKAPISFSYPGLQEHRYGK